ncbi:hypothetical protein ACSRUE_22440 [Sorangium sp. KYC3313]|uniref:hypothetical protein n=1 Tax=Sorangium sp. KYC3313 TaxID=3449740 RepID=UPI003F891591
MFRSTMGITALSFGLFAAGAPGDAMAHGNGVHRRGQIFVMTNAGDGNSVTAYDRASDGSLSYAGTYATGGLRAPTRPINALGSQSSLVLSEDGKLLFAVNAGSSEVSMFRVGPHGLTLLDVVDSGGDFPIPGEPRRRPDPARGGGWIDARRRRPGHRRAVTVVPRRPGFAALGQHASRSATLTRRGSPPPLRGAGRTRPLAPESPAGTRR